jgi:hypothetical protein
MNGKGRSLIAKYPLRFIEGAPSAAKADESGTGLARLKPRPFKEPAGS